MFGLQRAPLVLQKGEIVSAVMPTIGENPTLFQADSSKTVTGKASTALFSSELAKATDVLHPSSPLAAIGESQARENTPTKAGTRRATTGSERSSLEHSTSASTIGTTYSQESPVAQTTVALSALPVATGVPLAAPDPVAPEPGHSSSDQCSSADGSSTTQTGDASSIAALSTGTAGSPLQFPAHSSQFSLKSPVLLTGNSGLETFDCGTSTVEVANSLETGCGLVPSAIVPSGLVPSDLTPSGMVPSGLVPSAMVPSASTLRTTDVNGEHADTVAKAGDKPGTSKQTQAGALGVSKTVADAFPIHATDRETSSEAAIHRQPKQGTDIAVDANHTPKVSQSLIDSTTIYTTRVDTSKVDTSKTDTSKTDTSKVDTSKTDTSKTDTSKTDTSKIDTSKIDTSKIDTSKIDTSKVDPRSEAIPETATGESGKGSQLPGNGTSDHGSKHEGNTAIPSTGPGLESKGIQQAHSQSDFANVIGAQTSSAAIATVASSSTAALMDPAQSGDVASTHSSTRTAIDRSEQQAVEANPLTALQSPLQSARLIERVGQSELRVGFQAGELGSVDIRTSIVHNQVSAEISVERSELRNLLAIELPHLQEKLAAHQVTVTNIVLNNQSGGGSADSRQAYRQIAHTPQRSTSGPAESEAIPGAMSITESQIPSAQLDVHM
jgi:hypothetical protein